MSAKQKAHVRAKLRKQVRKNPAVIGKRSFLKKAALVDFKLPVTLRLRGDNTPGTCNGLSGLGNCQPTPGRIPGSTNSNTASLDLGASLGKREVDLGGKLAAEIVFHDSFDGGALGNVDLTILPSATKALTSTSIPLLWNTQVTQPGSRFEAPDLYLDSAGVPSGCKNFTGTNIPFGAGLATSGLFGTGVFDIPQPGGSIGYPVTDNPGDPTTKGYLPINAGVNDTSGAFTPRAGTQPGNDDIVGGNPAPFPGGGFETPSGFYGGTTGVPTPADTVLRTNALALTVANPTTVVNGSNGSGVQGSQNSVIGKSGGQANLFGNIPGKAYGIDVTVNLETKINSIIRAVDQDSFHTGLFHGMPWPAGIFNCAQIWTGWVQNYIPDVRLTGNLKIAPGITSDGKLRIAKATVASQAGFPAHFGVAACLFPYTTYAKRQLTSSGAYTVYGPGSGGYVGATASTALLPADPFSEQPRPTGSTQKCNDTPDPIVTNSGLFTTPGGGQVVPLSPASGAFGYTTSADGSRVSVAGDLDVQKVSIDVLIGDV